MEGDMRVCFTLVLVSVSVFVVKAAVHDNADGNTIPSSRGVDARGMLSSIAENIMSRGYATTAPGASQVVSLNLTNLLVLVLLKALIFAAGSIGAGHLKGGYGRSNDAGGNEKLLTEDEMLLFLGYLTGSPGDNGCLQSIACRQPEQAKKYAAAGDMLLNASKMFSFAPDRSYQYVLQELEQAANIGLAGGDCTRFKCGSSSDISKH